ncbi:MAG: XRE family transcriptional regulator [Phycisphaeraceae bacterium]|nr:MAG: XRE family transcriptional regulator [Phycisphaeraceae bacterium]
MESRDPAKIFAERLKASRDARGQSQSDLAARAGFQASAISHFETGRRTPSFDNLRRLANALNVTTDYLLGRVDEMDAYSEEANPIFREFRDMSPADQEFLKAMAKKLAERNQPKE